MPLVRPPFVFVCAAFALSASAAAAGVTSSGVIVPSNYYGFQPPARGGSYVDGAFGTTIKRLSNAFITGDAANGGILPWILNEYSTPALWNTPSSYLLLNHGSYFAVYDGNGNYIKDAPFDMHAATEPRWSRTDPNVVYYKRGNAVKSYNVATNAIATVRAFTEYGAISGRGKADIGFASNKMVLSGDTTSIFVYDADTNTKGPVFSTGGNGYESLHILANNQVMIGWNAVGFGRFRGLELFDANMSFVRQLAQSTGHMDVSRDVNGDPVVVYTSSADPAAICPNGITKIRVADGQHTCLLSLDWNLAVHISTNDQGWAVVSVYAPSDPDPSGFWPPYAQEVFRVRLDGTVVERLAHHRSRPFNSYNWMPKASISRDGTRITFSSNFAQGGASDYGDVYLINLGGSAPPPGPTPTPTPVPTAAPTPTPTPFARIEQNHGSVQISGPWTTQTKEVHSGGSSAFTKQVGAEATVWFTGTGIVWRGSRDPWAGQAQVYVDGALMATVDTYSAVETNQDALYTRTGLANTTHTLKVRVLGTMNPASGEALVWTDCFDILGGGPATPAPTAGPTPTPTPTFTPTPTPTSGTPPVPGSVVWKNLVRASAASGTLGKTSSDDAYDAGAVSAKSILSGDGFVEFTATRYAFMTVGLGVGDSSQHYNDVDFAVFLRSTGTFSIMEKGNVLLTGGGVYLPGDVFRVEIAGGAVRYKRNGALLHNSVQVPAYPLVLDTALYSTQAQVGDAKMGAAALSSLPPIANAGGPYTGTVGTAVSFSGAQAVDPDGVITSYAWSFGDGSAGSGVTPAHTYSSTGVFTVTLTVTDNDGLVRSDSKAVSIGVAPTVSAVTWTSLVQASSFAGTLTKTSGLNAYDAGAISTASIPSGDGYVEFTARGLGYVTVGLGVGNSSQHYADVDFAVFTRSSGSFSIMERGEVLGAGGGAYVPGDVFRVEIAGGVVRYRRNGALLYTSSLAPAYPLVVDTALYTPGVQVGDAKIAR